MLAKRTFAYMRLIALAAGVLVLIGLVLYLQSRQRATGDSLRPRRAHGAKRARAEIASLALELGVIALFAGLSEALWRSSRPRRSSGTSTH